jgi:hypothetical protein
VVVLAVIKTKKTMFECWEADRIKLFMCHTARHKTKANEVAFHLKYYGVSAFVAHDSIEPTRQWQDVIEYALRTTDVLAALVTPDFSSSAWTDQEVGVVFGRRKLIIPVQLGLDPYGFIGKYQALQGKGLSEEGTARKIFDILVKNEETQKEMGKALVAQFENSETFKNAKRNMELLEKTRYLDDALIRRLRTAAKRNSQITESWGVPEQLNQLISRFTE